MTLAGQWFCFVWEWRNNKSGRLSSGAHPLPRTLSPLRRRWYTVHYLALHQPQRQGGSRQWKTRARLQTKSCEGPECALHTALLGFINSIAGQGVGTSALGSPAPAVWSRIYPREPHTTAGLLRMSHVWGPVGKSQSRRFTGFTARQHFSQQPDLSL